MKHRWFLFWVCCLIFQQSEVWKALTVLKHQSNPQGQKITEGTVMPLSLMLDEGKFNQVMVIQLFALSFFSNMFWCCVREWASCDEQPTCYDNWPWSSVDSGNKLSHVLQLFLIGTRYLWKNHHCYYFPDSRLSESLMVDLEICEIQSWKGWLGNFSRNFTSSWCGIPYFGKSQPDRGEFESHWSCYSLHLLAYILRRT